MRVLANLGYLNRLRPFAPVEFQITRLTSKLPLKPFFFTTHRSIFSRNTLRRTSSLPEIVIYTTRNASQSAEDEEEKEEVPAHMKNRNPVLAPWGFHTNDYLVKKCRSREQKQLQKELSSGKPNDTFTHSEKLINSEKNAAKRSEDVVRSVDKTSKNKKSKHKFETEVTHKKTGFLQRLKSFVVKPKKPAGNGLPAKLIKSKSVNK